MLDWTPMVGYGTDITVTAVTTSYLILYPLPDYVAGDAEFVIESEEEQGIFLERIVGTVHMWSDETPTNEACFWRLLPLGAEFDTGTALLPLVAAPTYDSEWANLRWWDERLYVPPPASGTLGTSADTVDHPYWFHVDINPRQLMGAKRNLWPCLQVRNHDNLNPIHIRHRLRALWKYS